jgi:hypothetical protein
MGAAFNAALIIGIAAVVAAFVAAGRFATATGSVGGNGFVIIVDRYTGAARACVPSWCRDIPEERPGERPTAKK